MTSCLSIFTALDAGELEGVGLEVGGGGGAGEGVLVGADPQGVLGDRAEGGEEVLEGVGGCREGSPARATPVAGPFLGRPLRIAVGLQERSDSLPKMASLAPEWM